MTEQLTCKKCGYKFAASTIELMAGVVDCPRCGIPHANKYSPHIRTLDKHVIDPNADEGQELYAIAKLPEPSEEDIDNADKNKLRYGL